jgi:folate-binding protein YgfZ
MNPTLAFLAARGGRPQDGAIVVFGDRAGEFQAATGGAVVCDASAFGLVTATGEDAESFLHGQLSSDVRGLAPSAGGWSSYNSPKGRMLATLFVVRHPVPAHGFLLLVPAAIAEAVRKRLQMFVLRAKVTLVDGTPDRAVLGVGGAAAATAVARAFGEVPAAGKALAHGQTLVVALPDGRYVVLATIGEAPAVYAALAGVAHPAGAPVWAWLGIRAGVPMLAPATQDQFVPQTANWDVLGGVDFHKGCYPGQEIVARTQYLGRLKERLRAYHVDAPPPAAGTRIFGPVHGDQACGTVANAAPAPAGGVDLLAVVRLDAADAGGLRLDSPDGPLLAEVPLPYSVPAPEAPRGRIA